ncbi:MAG: DedA family protein [Nitrospinae bacterium]|nr:DedA family protein [Nitrospinota bacterium]
MEFISGAVPFIMHIDAHLGALAQDYGAWTYAILFLIIFAETGLVVTPFLPGDSLLFALGALAAGGALSHETLFFSLVAAATLGNITNYALGGIIGPKVFKWRWVPFLKEEYLDRTKLFYEMHGAKAVILARFMPLFRTFVPFVAGIGAMNYPKFLIYSVVGCLAWIGSLLYGGYFFGNIPVVKNNFGLVVVGIIVISFIPAAVEFFRNRRLPKRA